MNLQAWAILPKRGCVTYCSSAVSVSNVCLQSEAEPALSKPQYKVLLRELWQRQLDAKVKASPEAAAEEKAAFKAARKGVKAMTDKPEFLQGTQLYPHQLQASQDRQPFNVPQPLDVIKTGIKSCNSMRSLRDPHISLGFPTMVIIQTTMYKEAEPDHLTFVLALA